MRFFYNKKATERCFSVNFYRFLCVAMATKTTILAKTRHPAGGNSEKMKTASSVGTF